MEQSEETAPLFLRLLEIVAALRAPDGCPWDREQTPHTIAPYLVEEAHEVWQAVESGDDANLCEELGDVLLEVALMAQMARETDRFTMADSLRGICDKLVRRHPHVFGDQPVGDADEVRASWARIKAEEKRDRGALEGVPKRLPALHRARRISEKAAGVGFDWDDPAGVIDKVREELSELERALEAGDRAGLREELGDLLFSVVNLGRHLEVDPEAALTGTVDKFLHRFSRMETTLAREGLHPADVEMDRLEALWQAAKRPSVSPESPHQNPPEPDEVG